MPDLLLAVFCKANILHLDARDIDLAAGKWYDTSNSGNHHTIYGMSAANYNSTGKVRMSAADQTYAEVHANINMPAGCCRGLTFNVWIAPLYKSGTIYTLNRYYEAEDGQHPSMQQFGVLAYSSSWLWWDWSINYGFKQTTLVTGSTPTSGTEWVMLTFVKEPTGTNNPTGKWYVNGQLDSTFTADNDITYSPYHSVVGRDSRGPTPGGYFEGDMALLQWWDQALDAQGVANLYSGACRPPATY